MSTPLLRTCRMVYRVPLWLLLSAALAAPALRAQSIPCLVGRGPDPNGWIREDDTPVGRTLRAADAAYSEPYPQLTNLYRSVIAAAENMPDTDTCKARALFYAAIYFRRSDPAQALALEQRSVAIDDAALPAGHPRRVLDLRDLAGFYDAAQKPAEAERLYREALNLLDTTQGLSNLERMFTYSTVADFYDRRKDFPQAEALYRQALDASQHLQLSMGMRPLNVRADLARVLTEEGKQDEAHILLNEPTAPIPILPLRTGPTLDLSGPMSDLVRAQQYAQEGNVKDAETSYLSAISTLDRMCRQSKRLCGFLRVSLNELGNFYHQQQRDAESEALLLRAFHVWEADAGDPAVTRRSYPQFQTLMLMYKDQGRLPEIEPLYLRAIELEDRVPEKDDLGLSSMLTDLAFIYCQEGKYEAALPLYQRVLAIEEARFGPNDPKLISFLDQCADALEKLNRLDEAAALRARSARLTSSARN